MQNAWNECWAHSRAKFRSSDHLHSGTGSDHLHLIVVMTTDRGLCGGFNGSIMRGIRKIVRDLEDQGKTVKLFGVGRKGNAIMRREFPDKLVEALEEISKPAPTFAGANMIANKITEMFDNGDFDCCTIVYNKFISAPSPYRKPRIRKRQVAKRRPAMSTSPMRRKSSPICYLGTYRSRFSALCWKRLHRSRAPG